jgi:hypothetical protein
MAVNRNRNLDLSRTASGPRRFTYRSAEPDAALPHGLAHPLRRSSDHRPAFRPVQSQSCPQLSVLSFRVYLKVN